MFSKACEYAIRAMVCIAEFGELDGRLGLKEIAERANTPEAFTAKILQKLSHAGLVESMKGPGGGFKIPNELAQRINLSDIVSTIDGNKTYTACALGLPVCSNEHPCPLHDQFLGIREKLRETLEGVTLFDLVERMKSGKTFLKS